MACLRQSYEDWLECEPEELESDRPSEEEMQAFDEAEKRHVKKVSQDVKPLLRHHFCVSHKGN
jgi:hypothetical protein